MKWIRNGITVHFLILIISIILYERQLDFLFYAYLLCLEIVDIDHTINV